MATITITIPDGAGTKVQAVATALGYANAAAWIKATLKEACARYEASQASATSGQQAKTNTEALFD